MTRIIAIASGKGGVGKTTLATNLSIALGDFGQRVIVVDCNLTTPHLSYYLGSMNYETTLNDILRGEVDIRHAISSHNGVMFVPASLNVNDLMNIDMKDLRNHIKRLEIPFIDYVFLDCAPGLGREAISALEACDEVFFITTPTIPNLMDVRRTVEVIGNNKKFNLVLNMVTGGRYEFTSDIISQYINIPIIGSIPFDKSVMDSSAFGVPLLRMKPNSSASLSFMKMAANLTGQEFNIYPTMFHKIIAGIKNRFLK